MFRSSQNTLPVCVSTWVLLVLGANPNIDKFQFLSLYSYSTQVLDICGVRTLLQCSDVNSIASPVHLPYKGFSAKMNIYLVMKS